MGTYGNGPGSKRIPRLMAESELPEIYMSDGNPISDEPEEIKGRGARERTRVKYDDGLTEEQWLQAVEMTRTPQRLLPLESKPARNVARTIDLSEQASSLAPSRTRPPAVATVPRSLSLSQHQRRDVVGSLERLRSARLMTLMTSRLLSGSAAQQVGLLREVLQTTV